MVIGVSGGLELHARADRRRQGLRPAGAAAHHHPRLHHAGLRHRGGDQGQRLEADARARVTAEEIDIRPAALQMLRGHGHPFAGGEPVYDITFENVQAGLQDGLSLPPRQPAPRLRHRHRRPLRAGARLVHLRRRGPDEPLRGQRRGAEDADPVPDPLGGAHRPVRPRRPTRCWRRSSLPRSRPSSSPPARASAMQSTEAKIGPYELHDFFLLPHHALRAGAFEGRLPGAARMVGRWRRASGRSTSRPRRGTPTTWGRSAGGWRCSWSASSR